MKIPKIFKTTFAYGNRNHLTVDDSQEQFEYWLKTQSIVYGKEFVRTDDCHDMLLSHQKDSADTHQGYLVCLEEIPRPCTHHEPETDGNFIVQLGNTKCKHCNKPLVAEWREA